MADGVRLLKVQSHITWIAEISKETDGYFELDSRFKVEKQKQKTELIQFVRGGQPTRRDKRIRLHELLD